MSKCWFKTNLYFYYFETNSNSFEKKVPFHSFSEIEKVFLRDVGKKPQEM